MNTEDASKALPIQHIELDEAPTRVLLAPAGTLNTGVWGVVVETDKGSATDITAVVAGSTGP